MKSLVTWFAAAIIIGQYGTMSFSILYSFRRCPYAIRARMAILASGMACELREVSLAKKPREMVLASPKATIPVMVLGTGTVLEESLDIMRYCLGHNDPELWLAGVTEQNMDLVTRNDDVFKNHLDHYKYPQRYNEDGVAHRDAGLAILADLDQRLLAHKFLTGDHCNMVDVAIFPFVRQFAAVNGAWFGTQPIPALATWLADFLASARFEAAMMTWPIWTHGDPITHFPVVSRSSENG